MLPGIAIICFGLATLAGALRRLYKGDEKFVLFSREILVSHSQLSVEIHPEEWPSVGLCRPSCMIRFETSAAQTATAASSCFTPAVVQHLPMALQALGGLCCGREIHRHD